MIDVSSMGWGAQLLGVAVRAPREAQRVAPLLASVDEAAQYAGVSARLWIGPETTVPVQRDGWICLGLAEADLADWRQVAMRHSGHCAWLALWDSERLMPRDWLLGKLQRADRGQSDDGLKRVVPESVGEAQWEAGDDAPLIGCTIITPGYEEVGAEAVARFQKFARLPVNTIQCAGKSGHGYKLSLPDLLPAKPCVFFDADLWLLRPVDLGVYAIPGGIAAVIDPGSNDSQSFVAHDIAATGMEAGKYFNSGLWIADFSASAVREAFAAAARLMAAKVENVRDYGEQSWLNLAVQRAKLPFRAMPPGLNFFMHSVAHGYGTIPQLVTGLHGAGIRLADKKRDLEAQAKVFGFATPANLREAAGALKLEPEPPSPAAAVPDDSTITNPHKANNDGTLPIVARTDRALRWLRDRESLTGLLKFEGVASCKCFLTYRCIDGLLDRATWSTEVAPVEHDIPQTHPLWVRWEISQRTAEFYLRLAAGETAVAEVEGRRLLRAAWEHDWLKTWQPMIANVLRVMSLLAYLDYLRGHDQQAVEMVEEAVRAWSDTMGAVDWKRWPMRFAEMRDDCHAILNCMTIARACGVVKFPNHAWADPAKANRQTRGEHPYMRLMRELGALCEARRLWPAA